MVLPKVFSRAFSSAQRCGLAKVRFGKEPGLRTGGQKLPFVRFPQTLTAIYLGFIFVLAIITQITKYRLQAFIPSRRCADKKG
jgi:hypothetical protein